MAFCISIKKIEVVNERGIYEVRGDDCHFYIEINIIDKIIRFSKNRAFDIRWDIDFNYPEKTIDIPWVPANVIYAIIVKGKSVIKSGIFYDNINFCS